MNELLGALVLLSGLNLLSVSLLLYRSHSKSALDPLGLEMRLGRVQDRMIVVETRLADVTMAQAKTEQKLFERLDDMRDTQSKMLGQIASLGARVDEGVVERREVAARLDHNTNVIANMARTFGNIESKLSELLTARAKEAGA